MLKAIDPTGTRLLEDVCDEIEILVENFQRRTKRIRNRHFVKCLISMEIFMFWTTGSQSGVPLIAVSDALPVYSGRSAVKTRFLQ